MFAQEQFFQIVGLRVEHAAEFRRELLLRRITEGFGELFQRAVEIFDGKIEFAQREIERREARVRSSREQVAFGFEIFSCRQFHFGGGDARPGVTRFDQQRGFGGLPRLIRFVLREVKKRHLRLQVNVSGYFINRTAQVARLIQGRRHLVFVALG
ncbi:MAG: hypothetical protein JMDDDDMK_03646 [Acidobacteria bacterium]|nr:hypothetical protein [Acidobacteriota bacterium]